MSMTSSLIDELRKSEQEWNQSNMFELARMCREAADTIWQLRDDLQQAKSENAKLRNMAYVYRACHEHINACRGCEELPECDALRRLRELGREIGIEVDE